jgi:hypothetical protein
MVQFTRWKNREVSKVEDGSWIFESSVTVFCLRFPSASVDERSRSESES